MRIAAWVMLGWCCATAAGAQAYTAKVIAVIDGDTLLTLQGNKKTTVRLAGIDAPEKMQPWGSESRAALTKLTLRKEVRVTPHAVDEYGRVVAELEVQDAPGVHPVNVNHEQLRRGMAWADPFHRAGKTTMELQGQAQRARLGLWQQARPQPPWAFRRGEERTSAIKPDTPRAGAECTGKRYCSQMASCEEAEYYFSQCGLRRLDRDGNGVPCENLCGAKGR